MATYLASEGFIAFQAQPNTRSMRIVLNNGIFYEFIPFDHNNFDADGHLNPKPETILIDDIEERKEYASLLSTNTGAWRYLLGDTIKFTSKENSEIITTGRTQHCLNLCGEHLSIENMNKAIESVAGDLNLTINEFAVAGIQNSTLWAHQWYVGTEETIDEQLLSLKIDEKLKALNDDYRVERGSALTAVRAKAFLTLFFMNG